MRKKEKAKVIQEILTHYFPHPKPPLQSTSHYTMLIAVLLSAQCTDERVNKTTPILFKLADTPEKMVQLPIAQIEAIIRSCGLAPRKARAIHALSQILIDKHQGKVPNTFEALEALPGVGHKTASVLLSQGFHIPAFPIDTHIHRCAKRWGLSPGKNVTQVEKDLKNLFPRASWNDLHIQIILFARTYCKARPHNKDDCPICSIL